MSTRVTRVIRGATAAAASALIAALSHVAGGGALPSGMLMLAALAISALFCIAVVGRRVRLLRTTLSVAFSQVAMHAVFSLEPVPMTTSGLHAHTHTAVEVATGAASVPHTMTPGAGMTLGHVLAGAVTVLLLRFGEAALTAIARVAARLLPIRRTDASPVPAVFVPPAPTGLGFVPSPVVRMLADAPRRGPPAPRAA